MPQMALEQKSFITPLMNAHISFSVCCKVGWKGSSNAFRRALRRRLDRSLSPMWQCWTSSLLLWAVKTFLVYSKQDVVARRPHVLSCGGYCVVSYVIVVYSFIFFS